MVESLQLNSWWITGRAPQTSLNWGAPQPSWNWGINKEERPMDVYDRLIENEDVRKEVMFMLDAAVKYANQLMQYQAACRRGRDT